MVLKCEMGFKSSAVFVLGVNQHEISREGKSLPGLGLLLCSLCMRTARLWVILERTNLYGQQMGGWPGLWETALGESVSVNFLSCTQRLILVTIPELLFIWFFVT